MTADRRFNVCFHGIGTPARELESGESAYWISPGLFEEILDFAAATAAVDLSFDDGNASDVEIALPALKARELRAAFFPLAARMDAAGSLSRDGLRALVADEMTIGSHGMTHKPWRTLDDAALDDEFVTARGILEEAAGVSIAWAACPLGSYDRRVLGKLRAQRYARVFTSDASATRPDAWLQARYSVRAGDTVASIRALIDAQQRLSGRTVSAARIAAKRLR
jgi:peptidoglycan/xylan/chitin deacetylase (PgdA/CDA1 family)